MEGERQAALKRDFAAAFFRQRYRSQRARDYWLDALEILQDNLAGPLHSIVEQGGCAYVYARNDSFFTSVADPCTLRARLRHWHCQMGEAVLGFVPASADEATDQAAMRETVAALGALLEAACDVERDRWVSRQAG